MELEGFRQGLNDKTGVQKLMGVGNQFGWVRHRQECASYSKCEGNTLEGFKL